MLAYLAKIFEKMLYVRLNDNLSKTTCWVSSNTIFAITISHTRPSQTCTKSLSKTSIKPYILYIFFRSKKPLIQWITPYCWQKLSTTAWEETRPTGPSPAGGSVVPGPPHLKSVPPNFTFGPPVAAYIQYCIFKMWPPLLVFGPSFWFLAPLLLNPGDGPGVQSYIVISFREKIQ